MDEIYPPGFSPKAIRRIEVWRKEVASASASSATTSGSLSTTGASNSITPTTTVTTQSGSAKSNIPSGARASFLGGVGGAVPVFPPALASPIVDSKSAAGAITTNAGHAQANVQANVDLGRTGNGDHNADAEVDPTAKHRRTSSIGRFFRRIIPGFKDKKNNTPTPPANEHLEGYEPTAMYDAEAETGAGAAVARTTGAPAPAEGLPNPNASGGGPLGDVTINIDATLTDVDQAISSSSDERTGKGLRVREERLERAKKLLDKNAAARDGGESGGNVQAQK